MRLWSARSRAVVLIYSPTTQTWRHRARVTWHARRLHRREHFHNYLHTKKLLFTQTTELIIHIIQSLLNYSGWRDGSSVQPMAERNDTRDWSRWRSWQEFVYVHLWDQHTYIKHINKSTDFRTTWDLNHSDLFMIMCLQVYCKCKYSVHILAIFCVKCLAS